ncbi:hypothetical protein DPMN_010399 [Dreissena polymorpha]|uniref:Uncharacterized protein n=1 Tax=Dreissena polymorpha TaxID=45954 RepID=A0A9D4S103_DREPO|nr:hypothetical protein DPMN_010399 [Dreissena polymorpha]
MGVTLVANITAPSWKVRRLTGSFTYKTVTCFTVLQLDLDVCIVIRLPSSGPTAIRFTPLK